MAKRCRHKMVRVLFELADEDGRGTRVARDGGRLVAQCVACLALGVRPLGAANDADLAVEHELAAAALVARWASCGDLRLTHAESSGYAIDEQSPFAQLAAWHIGFLVREAIIDEDDGWSWNISRPLAGQFEGWVARTDHIVEAMEADAAAEFEELGGDADPVAIAAAEMFGPEHAARDERAAPPEVAFDVAVGAEPERGLEIDLAMLPAGSHDRADCPCDHPPGEVGPCGGCNCADQLSSVDERFDHGGE